MLRHARATDLNRVAELAARSFKLSPWNDFYRPHAEEFTEDVEASYYEEYETVLYDHRKMFVVIEVETGMGKGENAVANEKSKRLVVGVAVWTIPPEKKKAKKGHGSFSNSDIAQVDRSVDRVRSGKLFDSVTNTMKEYFRDPFIELDSLAVDPNFFRRGYGTLLTNCGLKIGQQRRMTVALAASKSGKPLYDHLGFETVLRKVVEDQRPGHEAAVEYWVQKWTPKKLLPGVCARMLSCVREMICNR